MLVRKLKSGLLAVSFSNGLGSPLSNFIGPNMFLVLDFVRRYHCQQGACSSQPRLHLKAGIGAVSRLCFRLL